MKATPTPSVARESKETRYWRLSTLSKENIDIAVRAGLWGTARGLGTKGIAAGDRVVFYVSRGRDAGYWGTATVRSGVFKDHVEVWLDDIYPFRFKLAVDKAARTTSVKSPDLMARLGAARLTHVSQIGVIPLTAKEFRAIEELLAESSDSSLSKANR